MKVNYRAIVWGFGSAIFSLIVYSQLAVWIGIAGMEVGYIIGTIILIMGLIIGVFLDNYYREKSLATKSTSEKVGK